MGMLSDQNMNPVDFSAKDTTKTAAVTLAHYNARSLCLQIKSAEPNFDEELVTLLSPSPRVVGLLTAPFSLLSAVVSLVVRHGVMRDYYRCLNIQLEEDSDNGKAFGCQWHLKRRLHLIYLVQAQYSLVGLGDSLRMPREKDPAVPTMQYAVGGLHRQLCIGMFISHTFFAQSVRILQKSAMHENQEGPQKAGRYPEREEGNYSYYRTKGETILFRVVCEQGQSSMNFAGVTASMRTKHDFS